MSEDRYEAIELIVKCREDDGLSWFDVIYNLIASDCEGGGGDCLIEDGDESDCDYHEHTDLLPCTCGLEAMGGSEGSLDEMYRHQGIADDLVGPVKKADLLEVLDSLDGQYANSEAAIILRRECTTWEDITYGEEEAPT